MLKKLEDTGHQSVLNKSSIKDIRKSFISKSKLPEQQFQAIVPKKASMTALKVKSGQQKKVQIIVIQKQIVFAVIQQYVIPSLRIVHKYPSLYPKFCCDKGALKYIINGANVMCPGLTHPNASMQDVQKGTLVALYVEGKTNALAIGITVMSTAEIRAKNQDIAVNVIHYLGDAFWRFSLQGRKK